MIRNFQKFSPQIGEGVFLAETAVVIGNVVLEKNANIWYGAVLRGDHAKITVGEGSNVQDNAVLHGADDFPVTLGKNVTVGHNAIVHGCTVGDGCMIGMGSIVLNGAKIGKNCLIAAGALVKEGQEIPDGSLVVGVPGRVVRTLSEDMIRHILKNGENYVALAGEYEALC